MHPNHAAHFGIPISLSLEETMSAQQYATPAHEHRKRLLYISLLAVIIGASISAIARLLVYLINLVTNLSFHLRFSIAPAIGGLVVGLMALYGSRAIRGHGIPEAMEQIITNRSKIRPSITYLKPVSSAISIGTGGPFGAAGPIIATGGALGSTLG